MFAANLVSTDKCSLQRPSYHAVPKVVFVLFATYENDNLSGPDQTSHTIEKWNF